MNFLYTSKNRDYCPLLVKWFAQLLLFFVTLVSLGLFWVCMPIFLTIFFSDEFLLDEFFFDEFLFWRISFFDEFFLTNFFLLTNFFDEFYWRIFFDEFFWRILIFRKNFLTYNLLTIASFRIGVSSILFLIWTFL